MKVETIAARKSLGPRPLLLSCDGPSLPARNVDAMWSQSLWADLRSDAPPLQAIVRIGAAGRDGERRRSLREERAAVQQKSWDASGRQARIRHSALSEMYSQEAIDRRVALRHHAVVVAALKAWERAIESHKEAAGLPGPALAVGEALYCDVMLKCWLAINSSATATVGEHA